jgi:hypothetical protein
VLKTEPRSPKQIATILGFVFLAVLLLFFYDWPKASPTYVVTRSECEDNIRHFRATVQVMGTGKETSAEQLEAQTEGLAVSGRGPTFLARTEQQLREHGCQ